MLHAPPAICRPAALRPSLTFYRDTTTCANGKTYGENLRRYHYFVASNHWPLGTRLALSSRYGAAGAIVCDRVGHGTDYDADLPLAEKLMGRGWRKVGRVPVRVRRIGPAWRGEYHAPKRRTRRATR